MDRGVLVHMITKREFALQIADRLLFQPYLWGGDNPLAGFDCSGFIIELLKSVGTLPREGDWTAEGLRNLFASKRVTQLGGGVLVFWSKASDAAAAGHVEMVYAVIGNVAHTIGASGGGSKTDSLQDAIQHDAYVKIRPVRDGWFFAVDPFAS